MHNTINISELENSKNKKITLSFDADLQELETEAQGVVHADLTAEDLGDFIKVYGCVEGNAKLICDLCLEPYDYKIDLDIDELFAKNSLYDEYKQELEIKDGQFVTDLNGADEIDISDILYQSVILDFPNKKVCGINCNGGDIFIRDENPEQEPDPRMAIFKDIKIERKD